MANELKEVESKLLLNKCDKSVVKTFIDFCNDEEYYEKANIFEDLEDDIDDNSCICLHMKTTLNWNNKQLNNFVNLLRKIVSDKKVPPLKLNDSGAFDINWNIFKDLSVKDKNKCLDETEDFLRLQLCDNDIELDAELLQLLAIGRLNNIPNLLSTINNIYNLSQIEHVILKQQSDEKESQFRNNQNLNFSEMVWTQQISPYFNKHNQSTLVTNALRTYSKRICLNSLRIPYTINDFLMDYIKYILLMNNVISSLLKTTQKNIPFQIDMCIIGRNYVWENVSDFQHNIDCLSDDFSEETYAATSSNKMTSDIEEQKSQPVSIPNFEELFEENNIKYSCVKADLQNCNPFNLRRDMQKKMEVMLKDDRFQRICVLIDRTNGKNENNLKLERNMIDKIYIYKVPIAKWSEINHDYVFETLIWKTKEAIIPNLNSTDNGKMYIGTDDELFDRKFVTSYHINSEMDIQCVQYFGMHSFLLLPFHLIKLFPCYFSDNFKGIDGNYKEEKYIYDEWCLPICNKLMEWISFIDPQLSKILTKKHEKYIMFCGSIM